MNSLICVESYSFGCLIINGTRYTGDLLIVHGVVQPSWWRQNGHAVDVVDVTGVLESNPEYLVIGQGKPGLMKSTPILRSTLNDAGIHLIEEPTDKAFKSYNELILQGKNVVAGFHLTC